MRRITPREKLVVKTFLETGSKKKAGAAAYPNIKPELISTYTSNLFKRPVVKRYLEDLLDEQGLSDERIAHKLKKIVDAGTRRGALRDTSSQTALEAIKFTAKLKNIIPAQKVEQTSASLNVSLSGKSEEELQALLDNTIKDIEGFKRKFMKPQEIKVVES